MGPTLVNMYFLSTTGYGYSKKLCNNVVGWFLNQYLPRHKLYVDVHHRGLLNEGAFGYCDYTDQSYKPRDFTIELHARMDKKLYVETLLHELIHLRQWVRGTLKFKAGKMMFNDENVSKYEYMDQPHEIEAYALEGKLYSDWYSINGGILK